MKAHPNQSTSLEKQQLIDQIKTNPKTKLPAKVLVLKLKNRLVRIKITYIKCKKFHQKSEKSKKCEAKFHFI